MDESLLTTVIMGAGAALSGAVGVLFRIVMKLQDKQTETAKELGRMEGRHRGIENLSAQVLETVRRAITDNGEQS